MAGKAVVIPNMIGSGDGEVIALLKPLKTYSRPETELRKNINCHFMIMQYIKKPHRTKWPYSILATIDVSPMTPMCRYVLMCNPSTIRKLMETSKYLLRVLMQVSLLPHWYVHNACNECRVSSAMFECRMNMNQLVLIPLLHQVVKKDHTQVSELNSVCALSMQ